MKALKELRSILCDELEKITEKGGMSAGALDVVDKITHSIKSIDTILMYENAGYSEEGGYSYNNTNNGNGRGIYSRNNSYGGYYGYSREESKDKMVRQLKEMLDNASSDKERNVIRQCINSMEQL